ncbi:MAG: hypothetical protein Q8877_02675 [Sweet potato little leaf phytoplasma]|nr:hypothetical protein [Sweet potato little leaf phytoplasma]
MKAFQEVASPVHMEMKFPGEENSIITVRAHMMQAKTCYLASLKATKENAKKRTTTKQVRGSASSSGVMMVDLDMIEDIKEEHPKPEGELEKVQIGGTSEH